MALTLLDGLIFKGQHTKANLLVLCLLEQGPSIFLSPLAGLWMDRLGIRKWLTAVNVGKCFSVGLLAFTSSIWAISPVYLCFKIGSVFFYIGRLSLTASLIPKEEIISFN